MVHTDYVEGDTVFTSSPLFSDGDYKDNSFSRTNSIDSSLTSETKDFLLLTKTKSTISHYGSIAATALIETDEKENSSTLGASLNLFNAIMGTGIIGLPLALHLCGFWTGLFFAVSIGYLTCMAMHITILCGLHTKTVSLPGLCGSMLGHVGSHIINFIIFFHTAGTAVSYYMCNNKIYMYL
jgi:hypothetical protein